MFWMGLAMFMIGFFVGFGLACYAVAQNKKKEKEKEHIA